MRALIADDEAPARAKLRHSLLAAGGVEIVGEASSGREAVAMVKRFAPDIIFLDIRMPGLDGFGVLDAIAADEAPYVVFVTADEVHALKAFEVGAVDYLLKPFTKERFDRVVARARERLHAVESTREPAPAAPPFLQRVLVTVDGRAAFLATDSVDRIEAEGNYVTLRAAGHSYRLRATLGAVQRRLDPAQFLRINRSTVVRLDAVRGMHEWSHGDYRVVMHDGTELTWSRRYRAEARRQFGLKY